MMDPEATTSPTFWFKNIAFKHHQVTAQLQKVTKLKTVTTKCSFKSNFKVIVL